MIISLLWITLLAASSLADPPLKKAPKGNKISDKFTARLDKLANNDRIKVWIFFTDKGVFDENAYKKTIDKLYSRFTPKAISRRAARTDDEEIFNFDDIPVNEDYVTELSRAGLEIVHRSRWLNAVSAYSDKATLEKIKALPFIYEIRPVAVATRIPIPDDQDRLPPEPKKQGDIIPDSVRNWYGYSFTELDLVNIPLMHQLGYTGQGITIAVLDGGFDLTHPAFNNINLCDECKYDFVNNDTTVGDEDNSDKAPIHGTATLSLIAGREDSVFVGSAYDADFIVAKTERIESEIQSEEDDWVAGAEWADSLGTDIISSSLGYYDWYTYQDLDGQTAVVTIAAEAASANGIVVVNSAGNARLSAWYYITPPADGPSVIAVGAVDSFGIIANFSSAGPTYDGRIKPDVVAMGVANYKADYNTGLYGTGNGTSYACPITAGAVALILQAHPDWTPADVRQALISSANRYDAPDDLYGYGLYDAYKAADLLRFDSIPPARLSVGDTLDITFTISGLEDSANVIISANNLPETAEFTDNGDRTASLFFIADNSNVGANNISLTAFAGLATATYTYTITVFAEPDLVVGPNPFTDSVSIFLGPESGNLEEISIYSSNGEKVWDKYTDTYNIATGSVVWQGVNNSGNRVSSGVYLILVKTDTMMKKVKVFRK